MCISPDIEKEIHLPIQLFGENFGNWSELSTLKNTYCPSSFYKKTRKTIFKPLKFLKINFHGLLFFHGRKTRCGGRWGYVSIVQNLPVKTKIAREKNKVFARENDFLPVKKP